MFDQRVSRKYTAALLDAVDEGMFDRDSLIRDLVGWMSEDDVREFVQRNDLMPWLEDEEDEDA